MQTDDNAPILPAIAVTGWSMAPLLRPGDRVVLDGGVLRVGEVVVVAAPERLLVHRIAAIVDGGDGASFVVTRGDRVARCDAPSPVAAVLGRVVAVERNGRRRPLPQRSQASRWWLRVFDGWQRRKPWK